MYMVDIHLQQLGKKHWNVENLNTQRTIDEHLCNIKQIEFEGKSSPASNPRVSNAFSYNQLNSSLTSSRDEGNPLATYQNTSSLVQSKNWKQNDKIIVIRDYALGAVHRCNENLSPRHRCKTSTSVLLDIANDSEKLVEGESDVDEIEYDEDINQQDMAQSIFSCHS
nr:hypothetical protein [Tanacetum cinerariifolium]